MLSQLVKNYCPDVLASDLAPMGRLENPHPTSKDKPQQEAQQQRRGEGPNQNLLDPAAAGKTPIPDQGCETELAPEQGEEQPKLLEGLFPAANPAVVQQYQGAEDTPDEGPEHPRNGKSPRGLAHPTRSSRSRQRSKLHPPLTRSEHSHRGRTFTGEEGLSVAMAHQGKTITSPA